MRFLLTNSITFVFEASKLSNALRNESTKHLTNSAGDLFKFKREYQISNAAFLIFCTGEKTTCRWGIVKPVQRAAANNLKKLNNLRRTI